MLTNGELSSPSTPTPVFPHETTEKVESYDNEGMSSLTRPHYQSKVESLSTSRLKT